MIDPHAALARMEAAGWAVALTPDTADIELHPTREGLALTPAQVRWVERHRPSLHTCLLRQRLALEEQTRYRTLMELQRVCQRVGDAERRAEAAEQALRLLSGRSAPPPIPADIRRRLRSLCHPDRWQGQPQQRAATEVMQWVNTLE